MWVLADQLAGVIQGLLVVLALNFLDRVEQTLLVLVAGWLARDQARRHQPEQYEENTFHRTDNTLSFDIFH